MLLYLVGIWLAGTILCEWWCAKKQSQIGFSAREAFIHSWFHKNLLSVCSHQGIRPAPRVCHWANARYLHQKAPVSLTQMSVKDHFGSHLCPVSVTNCRSWIWQPATRSNWPAARSNWPAASPWSSHHSTLAFLCWTFLLHSHPSYP